MPKNVTLELKCKQRSNGRYDGFIEDQDRMQPAGYYVLDAGCEEILDLWRRARQAYRVIPTISGPCASCVPQESFQEIECPVCHGSGDAPPKNYARGGTERGNMTCGTCAGTGYVARPEK